MIQRDNRTLSDRAKDEIIRLITTEKFSNNRLPSETKLAKQFGVSVPVVREALLMLREDGVVTKKQGVGNFFHLSALHSGVRIDRYHGFNQLLTRMGYKAGEQVTRLEMIVPPEKIRERLSLPKDGKTVHYERTVFADGHPAILCDNWLPLALFSMIPDEKDLQTSLFDIFDVYMNKELGYGQLQFFPCKSTAADVRKLGVKKEELMIRMEESYFSLEDIPLAFSSNKLNGKYITVTMLSR